MKEGKMEGCIFTTLSDTDMTDTAPFVKLASSMHGCRCNLEFECDCDA